jgi:phage terminase small subunit
VSKLTEKQKAFCDYYIQTLNATESAKKAGYSEKTARKIGHENLTKPDIQNYISERLAELESKRVADAKEVLEYLTSVMRGEQAEEVVVVENIGDFMSEARIVSKKLNARERIKAAELLGKRYALFTDKVDSNLNVGIQIVDDVPNED